MDIRILNILMKIITVNVLALLNFTWHFLRASGHGILYIIRIWKEVALTYIELTLTQHHYVLGIVLCVHIFAQLILIALGEVEFYCYPRFTYVEAEVQGG